jgi:uncharacterized protein
MTTIQLALLTIICSVTSSISVVTGSTSLITVPAMFQFNIEPRVAIATNMFALTFMSLGGSLPFLKGGEIDRKRLPLLIAFTLAGSFVGAVSLVVITAHAVPVIVSAAMLGVALFSLFYRKSGGPEFSAAPSLWSECLGHVLTFALGIYGGFFSGGYVTLLTAVYVALFHLRFVEAVATTKLVNIFSSGIATLVFMRQHLVNYRLGGLLAAAMFLGAWAGGHMARKVGDRWLKRIFLTAVWALGLKTLLYDVLTQHTTSGRPASEP